MEGANTVQEVTDLTTRGFGVNPDAEPLVYRNPRIEKMVPGKLWVGQISSARAVVRLPRSEDWNGKLLIGATPGLRNEFSLDLLLGDIVLQRGYAFASCDKGTPGLDLRDPSRSMAEWRDIYEKLTQFAQELVVEIYGRKAGKTYISGVSNGGYITRIMLEQIPEYFDGGVEWEGVLWHETTRHILTTLPVCVADYPIYRNWRGDRTRTERHQAYERLLAAGLHPESDESWDQYYLMYWLVSLWIYGRNLDPDWVPFEQEWSNDWLQNPSAIAAYPWQDRLDILAQKIRPIANTGEVQKPLLSVAGNWDCQLPFRHNALAYAEMVQQKGFGRFHRMYEIDRGNHVDGLLRPVLGHQQPVQPYYEAALYYLEDWVERGKEPPASGLYQNISEFSATSSLLAESS